MLAQRLIEREMNVVSYIVTLMTYMLDLMRCICITIYLYSYNALQKTDYAECPKVYDQIRSVNTLVFQKILHRWQQQQQQWRYKLLGILANFIFLVHIDDEYFLFNRTFFDFLKHDKKTMLIATNEPVQSFVFFSCNSYYHCY